MKANPLHAALLLGSCLTILFAADNPIDWNRARQLNQRVQRGEKLNAEEQAYYNRARVVRNAGQAPIAPSKGTEHFTPLTELGLGKYKGEDGGLYGKGQNQPSNEHLESAFREAARIQPLDREGKPSAEGKIVLLSVGMSNTTQEFSRFMQLANADPAKWPRLIIVDGAQGGQEATRTSDPSAPFWATIDERLQRAGVGAKQVQAIWLKQAIAGPQKPFPAEANRLQEYLVSIVHIIKQRYPNTRLCYLSSRIYAGYATSQLNPEPHAYESAFAVRWLILDQIRGNAELNYDPARGDVKSPLLLWGPYLWADGETPRKEDGLVYKQSDLGPDGTHPSESGRQKVAEQLLKFFKTDPTARWFSTK